MSDVNRCDRILVKDSFSLESTVSTITSTSLSPTNSLSSDSLSSIQTTGTLKNDPVVNANNEGIFSSSQVSFNDYISCPEVCDSDHKPILSRTKIQFSCDNESRKRFVVGHAFELCYEFIDDFVDCIDDSAESQLLVL